MGNQALLVALAAVLGTSLLLFSTRSSTQGADQALGAHVYKVIARDGAVTGLNLTIRKLVSDTASWQVDPSLYEFTDAPYRTSTFTTDVSSPYGASVRNGDCWLDTVDVISTGFALGDSAGTHRIEATYLRSCGETIGTRPPAFDFAIASDMSLTFSTELPVILDGLGNYSANVHSNALLQGKPSPYVEGTGTSATELKCTGCIEWHPDPDNPASGGNDPDMFLSDPIDMDYIDPDDWRPKATHVTAGDVTIGSPTVIDFTNFVDPKTGGAPITGYGTDENPFIWLMDGNGKFKVSTDVQFLGVGWIVLTGMIEAGAGANIYSTIDLADPKPPEITTAMFRSDPEGTIALARNYAQTYLSGGMDLMIIAGDPGDDAWKISGNGVIMAANYANGKSKVADYLTFWGSTASMNTMAFAAEPMTIYIGASEGVLSPLGGGAAIPLPEGIKLLSYAEW
ncbi:MAG TPA: hypothetical protein VJB15_07005 [Rhodothermia bacterium]|nr:hypothetical protein [Rhodothermia bacterium]